MKTKSNTRLALFGLGLIAVIGAVAAYLYLPDGQETPKMQSQNSPDKIAVATIEPEINQITQQASTEPVKTKTSPETEPVKDKYPVPQEIEENIFAEAQRAADLANARKRSIAWKNAGNTVWGSENWMKPPEYYQKLTTEKLAEECFERTIFGNEMSIYNDPAYGFIRLEVHHNGFAELFKRDNMWEGILHIYYQTASKITPQSDFRTIVAAFIQLDGVPSLYNYPPFQKQLKEHELDFFLANIFVLKQSLQFLETYNPKAYGLEPETPLFYGEVYGIARTALKLIKEIDPELYRNIETDISNYKWPHDQKNEYLKHYLKFVLDQFSPLCETE